MLALRDYGAGSEDDDDDNSGKGSGDDDAVAGPSTSGGALAGGMGVPDEYLHLLPPVPKRPTAAGHQTPGTSAQLLPIVAVVDPTPMVTLKEEIGGSLSLIHPDTKELTFNPKYDQLYLPEYGPVNPLKTQQELAQRTNLSGFAEKAQFNDFQFESQWRTFNSFGYAHDPSVGKNNPTSEFVGDLTDAKDTTGATVFENTKKNNAERKRVRNWDSADMDGYIGPWGGYEDEEKVSCPDAATLEVMEDYARKRKKLSKVSKDDTTEENSILHIKDAYDYQGRSFLHAPHDITGVNLRSDTPPDKCFIPKRLIHTWSGHTKPVQTIRWYPHTAHLLLSASMDSKIKLWEVYGKRRCVRTYLGHRQAVRDVTFNNGGEEFLSASYDRFVKLWDTETGQCKERFTTGKVPYCLRYHPDEDKQHMFLAGMADKKIIQWDIRSGEIIQEYDRHLGAVNTITFFDNNRRFCTTSDDKSMRIWEWEIPVDTKLIQDASLHSMPVVTTSPNQKWLACQSMDNKVLVFQILDEKVRFHRRKQFKGHMVAGYACGVDFSPEMSYIVSGDADGRVWIWDWKTHKLAAKWKAHEEPCAAVLWNPHETSKLATAGWDGEIKYWD